jgi:hypothetical protein
LGFKVQKNVNQFLFYSSHIVWVNNGDIILPLLKHTDEIISLPSYYGYSGTTREVRVGYGSYANIDICFLAYKIVKNTEWSSQWRWATAMNEFNEASINSLQTRDTLAIQEYRVKFRAKQ